MQPDMHVLGIASAKRVLHAVGMDDRGHSVERQRWSRQDRIPGIAQLSPVRLDIAAWGGAHDGARRVRAPGHEVQRMAPPCVQPSGKSHKNDSRDAEASAAVVTRPPRRVVPIQDVDPQDLQARPRVRERLMGARTALVQAVHGLLPADGIVIPQGVAQLRPAVVGKRESAKAKRTSLSRTLNLSHFVEEPNAPHTSHLLPA